MHYSEKTDYKSVHYRLYITAAATAGLVCCTAIPIPVNTAAKQPASEKRPGASAFCQGLRDGSGASAERTASWDESQILENWGLDPDDFPEGENPGTAGRMAEEAGEEEGSVSEHLAAEGEEGSVSEDLASIPQELLPYFQAAVSEAVEGYAGYVPPSYDRTKYTPRAAAIRAAVSQKAREASSDYTKALLNGIALAVKNTMTAEDEPAKRRKELLVWPVQEYFRRTHGSDGEEEQEQDRVQEQEPASSGKEGQYSEKTDSVEVPAFFPFKSLHEKSLYEESLYKRSMFGSAGGGLFQSLKKEQKAHRTIFIGDSRTVGMYMYAPSDENEYWSAKDSMGYSWMADAGIPRTEDLIRENTDVVILMGVNDLGNVAKYVEHINRKAAEWKEKGARTFYVSVTPVVDSKSRNAKNARIEAFNDYLLENLEGVHYIDAYNRIRDHFGSPDGIHFDRATYLEIYRIIHFYLYKGWYEEAGLKFYFDCGRPRTGWNVLDGKWQYMDGNGVRWIEDGRVGDVCFEPYPEIELLNPYKTVRLK